MNDELNGTIRETLERGLARHQAGDLNGAIACYGQILARQPDQADALHYQGVALYQGGRFEAAIQHLEQAVTGKPDSAEAFNHYGCALLAAARANDAESAFRRAGTLNAVHAEAHFNLGSVLMLLDRPEEACDSLERALEITPNQPVWMVKLAETYKDLGRLDDAASILENMLQIHGSSIDAFFQRSRVRELKGQGSLAVRDLIRCAVMSPENFRTLNNLARSHLVALDANTSARIMDWAASLAPTDPAIRFNLANSLLAAGNLERGWHEYRWRHQKDEVRVERRGLPPEWEGGEIKNGGLLIYHEQGIGDEIRFASCLSDASSAVRAPCLVECDSRLIPLFSRSFRAIRFIEKLPRAAGPPTLVDYAVLARSENLVAHTALGELPRHVRPSVSSFNAARSYLVPDPDTCLGWRDKLARQGPGLKVGFLWRTGLAHKVYAHYFFDILDLRSVLTIPGVLPVNLQYDECENDLQRAEAELDIKIYRPESIDLRNDLDSLAALINELDVVVGPMTSVIALAGAMGTKSIGMAIGLDWTSLGTKQQPWTPEMTTVYKGSDRRWGDAAEDVATLVAALRDGEI